MIEIKFRAWSPDNKEMYFVNQDYSFRVFGSSVSYQPNYESEELEYYSTDPCDGEKLIHVMQYTGLKDKNGKEIYEGDLLREPAKNEWEKTNYSCFEVFFHDGDAHSDYNIGFTMGRMHNHGSICGGIVPSFKPKQVSKMEIIGNIFENKDLIKGGGK